MGDLRQSHSPSCNISGSYRPCECTEKHTINVLNSDEEQKQYTEENTNRTASETETNSENEQESCIRRKSRYCGPNGSKSGIGDSRRSKRYIGDFQLKDMSTTAMAQQYWYISRRRMNDYKKKIKKLQQSARRLNNRIAYHKALLKIKDEDENQLSGVLPEEREAAKKKTIWAMKVQSPLFNHNIVIQSSSKQSGMGPDDATTVFGYRDVTSEQLVAQRLAELQARTQYLDSMYRSRQEDLQQLTQHFDQIYYSDNASTSLLQTELRPEIKQMMKNMSGLHAAGGVNPPISLRFPSAYYFLPHLLDDPNSLKLGYLMSKNRNGVSLVMGVPTVRREKQSYLMDTLQNLVDGLTEEEADDSLIIVFVGETDLEYILQIAKDVEVKFPIQVDSGLIEVVAPSPGYYPDFSKLHPSLGDPPDRVRWRSKQNLDFAFLMAYSQPKGTFYVQLEDDIIVKPSYVTIMKKFAIEKISKKEPWFVLDFCQLGFIGKMFKSAELPWLIQFFQMFFNDKPVDWLLDHLITTKICNWDKNDNCKADKAKVWIHFKPSLFQHIGTHSSLKGKVQKLKDKQFGKVALFFPHSNPEAEVISGIKHYKQYTLKRAYLGETFFWGLLPQPGDQLVFKFTTPVTVKRFHFRSGNAEHPSDKFYNTTVEVLPVTEVSQNGNWPNITSDGYVIVGKFDGTGIATGTPDESIGKVKTLRLNVHSESDNWAILSEIHIQNELSAR